MDLKRILTTVIGIPAVVIVFLFGNIYVVGGIILIASIICMYEYFNVIKKVCKPIKWVGYFSNIFIILATFLNIEVFSKIILFSLPIIMLLLFLHVIFTDMKITFKDVAYTLLGICYIPLFLIFLELIRKCEYGKILIGYAFIISWSTDIFAYIMGSHFGKHKFSKISPKKSIEGCVAGLIGSIVVSIIYTLIANNFWGTSFSYIYIMCITLILSIISQIGDFTASSIKRFVDIKDYGNLIPGHGGMLDRIDSLLFLAPFTYYAFLIYQIVNI